MDKLWVRCGDQDDYHDFDGIEEASDYLSQMGVTTFTPCGLYAARSRGYRGQNYISVFWGDEDAQPIRAVTKMEFAAIRSLIKEGASRRTDAVDL